MQEQKGKLELYRDLDAR